MANSIDPRTVLMKIFLLCLIMTAGHVVAQGWIIEVVDPEGREAVSIATDSASHPHIAYTGWASWAPRTDYLKYTRRDSSGWVTETVDSSGRVDYVSLSLNENDIPHIGYYCTPSGDLKYARRHSSGWVVESVDTAGTVGRFASLGITSAGYAGISYYDQTSGDLKFATWDGEHWIIERVDTAGIVGFYSSLAFNAADDPHISYYDGTNHCLKYARRIESVWSVTVVDTPSHEYQRVGGRTSLALDSLGHPHISYHYWETYDFWINGLRYARWDGTEWLVKTPRWGQLEDPTGVATSIELDGRDYPCIAFLIGCGGGPYDPSSVLYTHWNGEEWRHEYIDSLTWEGNVSLSLDITYSPHIAYLASDTVSAYQVLKYATRPTSVSEVESAYASRKVILEQSYPNPFISETSIQYGLPEDTKVTLRVYNLLGQDVRVLVDERKDAGIHTMIWDGRDDSGRRVPSGTHFLRLEAGDYTATKKLSVIR